MKKIQSYGISEVTLNGYKIYTYKIRINYSEQNREIIMTNNIPYSVCRGKIIVEFATFDPTIFRQKTQRLGKALKQIATLKIKEKYDWVD